MNFINPYTSIYVETKELQFYAAFPFYREVIWTFLKHVNNKLGLFKHRVNITFVDSNQQSGTESYASIYNYKTKLEEGDFLTKTEEERRDILLNIVYRAFSVLAKEHGWNGEIIDRAYQKSKDENGIFGFQSAIKSSRSRNYTGALLFILEDRNLIIHCAIQDKSNNSFFKAKLLETDEDNFSWKRWIKEYGWYDNNRFGLKFLNGDYWIVYDIQNQTVEELINPNKNSIKEIENCKRELKSLPTIRSKNH
jgi:hypothetical protein